MPKRQIVFDLKTNEGFVEGEGVELSFTGSRTDVGGAGQKENTFTYTAKEGTNLNNYEISATYGDLVVTKATMSVEAVDYDGAYDGDTHNGGATPSVTAGTTIQYSTDDGETWSNTVPSIKDVGTVSYKVKASNPNYEDATDEGTLNVSKKEVTLESKSLNRDICEI